jgi:hypothetical protein
VARNALDSRFCGSIKRNATPDEYPVHRPKQIPQRIARWVSPGTLALLACTAFCVAATKRHELPVVIDAELNPDGWVICPAVPVANLYAIAREVKQIASEQHADLLLVGGGDREKDIDYSIPCLTGIETLYPDFERRTFRLIEESHAHHQKILIIFDTNFGRPIAGGQLVTLRPDGTEVNSSDSTSDPNAQPFILPQINVVDANGKSAYDLPELGYWLPRLIQPDPTPENSRSQTQVYRPTWHFH